MVQYARPSTFLLLFLMIVKTSSLAQKSKIRNNYASQKNIPQLSIERSMIYEPEKNWMYSHHPSIAHFKGRFVATWSNGIKDEDSPGQRVLFSTSTDFFHWSMPEVLANPSVYDGDTLNVLTAAGLYQHGDTLVAYYGEYSPIRTNTHLWAKYSKDGLHWSGPLNMHVPVNPNHGPTAIASGRLIICGNFTFPYTDDPSGLRGWKMSSFYSDSLYKEDNPATFEAPSIKMHLPPLCEGSFFQTDDHVIHMLLRATDDGWKGKLWLTESKDNGVQWSFPVETNFTDNDSKFHFGRLPDKRFYYIGIPDSAHRSARIPLVFAISKNGTFFDKQYIIANQPYHLKQEGLWKDGQYGYPHNIIHNGYIYVIISRLKESVEIIRFKLKGL